MYIAAICASDGSMLIAGHLRFWRQVGADPVHARADVGQRVGGAEVQLLSRTLIVDSPWTLCDSM